MGFFESIASATGLQTDTVTRIAGTALILLLWLLISRVARRLIVRAVEDSASRFHMTRVTGYAIGGLALIILARLWIQGMTGLATYFGLLSAGVAIALQDPLTSLAGWLFILIRRPFRVGDRIELGGQRGDVVDIRPFRFVMLEIGNWVHADQSTGRILHVPNASIFKHPIANYDEAFGFIWNEIAVTVTFESNWKRAKEALEKIVGKNAEELDAEVRRRIDEAAESMHLKFTHLTPVVWTSVIDSGVRLTMRYLCRVRARRSSESKIWEDILDAFDTMTDVELAYPTTRFFDNSGEGKMGAKTLDHSVAPNQPQAPKA
jgi:small-conductance mechanosensitive channel